MDVGAPKIIRNDGGNENVVVAEFHRCNFDSFSGDNSLMIGRSIANKRIEMTRSFITKQFTQFKGSYRSQIYEYS